MIYLIYGKEILLIEKKMNDILKKEKMEEFIINKYDL